MANSEIANTPDAPADSTAAEEARSLVRGAFKAALATLDAKTGGPYASLITVATATDGSPLFLISTLARHTKNLAADARASLLFDGTTGLGDPLEGGRVSLFGSARKAEDEHARARFLARHPTAAQYADFADFGFYRLEIDGAHFVGGFGRIHELPPEALLTDVSQAMALLEAERDIIEHMNAEHADAVALYATRLLGGEPGPWRFAGCDPEGCDLVLDDQALRLLFPGRVTTPKEIRSVLAELARQARD